MLVVVVSASDASSTAEGWLPETLKATEACSEVVAPEPSLGAEFAAWDSNLDEVAGTTVGSRKQNPIRKDIAQLRIYNSGMREGFFCFFKKRFHLSRMDLILGLTFKIIFLFRKIKFKCLSTVLKAAHKKYNYHTKIKYYNKIQPPTIAAASSTN